MPGHAARGRVLFVANVAWFFASHRLPLALAARRAGYDVHVAANPDGADPIVASGLPFHPLPVVRSATGIWNDLALLRSLADLYRSLRPELVHHVTLKPVIYGSLAARGTGVPWVVNAVSGMGTLALASGARAHVRRAVVRPLLRLGSNRDNVRVIFQNPEDRADYVAAGVVQPDRAVLIPGSGVDLDLFRPSPEPSGVPVVMLPARVIYDKGVGEFVEAARLLRARGIVARFVLVGGLDPHNATEVAADTVQQWVADGIVEWWGHRADMAAALREANIVCLPSYREGMPKALLEAAAAGRAIVTTDTPGCRDCVEPGRTGLLVPPRDAPALAKALQSLLSDGARRAAFGAAGRALAERSFGLDMVIDRHLDLYRSLLAS
jgi:glycosyltransferase involved in cell wall biosynthesis